MNSPPETISPNCGRVTPPIPEILCVKNVRTIVVCGFLIKNNAENMKKKIGSCLDVAY